MNTAAPYLTSPPLTLPLTHSHTQDPYVKRWGYPGDLHYGDLHHYDFYSDCELPASFPK